MKALIVAMFAIGLGLGLACGPETSCSGGSEGCPCVQGACLTGLVCLSGYCVDPNWMPPGGEAGTNAAESNGESGSYDNVAACEALVEDFECGMLDLSMYVDCDLYADVACDVSDYFDCVRDDVECADDMIDAMQLADCAELAQCG
ncbi:MAG TPA: hypothetical protein VG755_40015 [Nannocystaceae bacterium]|nr:hypothetical protein [Nannocystaceae bacterium]